MQSNQSSGESARSGIATYVVEAMVALIILLLGVLVLQGSWNLGSRWTSDGPGSGYFPFYIGLILCFAGAAIMGQALFGKHRKTEIFVDNEQLKRVLSVLVPIGVYALVVQFLGLYVASAIYIAGFMVVLGHYPKVKSVVMAIVINVLLFCMFEIWFKVPLFKGSLDPLGFLGY
jgi:putative tricarboxylic transport membrane protein